MFWEGLDKHLDIIKKKGGKNIVNELMKIPDKEEIVPKIGNLK
jgi:hypothetical protein